jgi:ATP-binding protein involved in chromosome partitioning
VKDQVFSIVNNIKNPLTGSTLGEEKRVLEVEVDSEGHVKVKFDREGIDPDNKIKIEDQIYDSLKSLVEEDNLEVYSFSKNSADVLQGEAKAQKKPAQMQTGHQEQKPLREVSGVGKVIAVASGKGGVGKSTFAVNLALSLINMGKKVGIIDSDVYGPSIPLLMGQKDGRAQASEDNKIIPLQAFNLKFISFGLFIGENEPVIWRGPMLGRVLEQFLFDVKWGELDYLIIDLPPGTGDMQLSMVQTVKVDGSIIISTPQDVALLDAKKGLAMFKKVNVPVIGMVENMSSFICDNCEKEHYIFGRGGVEKAVKELRTSFLGKIPFEVAIQEGADQGKPYMSNQDNQTKGAWKAYEKLAENIQQKLYPEDRSSRFIKNLFRK